MEQLSTYLFRTVATQNAADEITKLLAEKDIESEVIKESFSPASTFGEGSLSSNFEIRIKNIDRDKAEAIMIDVAEQFLSNIDPEHYLFSFSDQELIDLLSQKYEWSEIDILLSEKILNDRGVKIDHQKLSTENEIRILELAEPTKSNPLWIILGYIFAFFGGLLGLLIAYSVMKAKRKLPDGTMVYDYDESTRRHASVIFAISLIVISLAVILRFSILA